MTKEAPFALADLLLSRAFQEGNLRIKHSRDEQVHQQKVSTFALQARVAEGVWRTVSNIRVAGLKNET